MKRKSYQKKYEQDYNYYVTVTGGWYKEEVFVYPYTEFTAAADQYRARVADAAGMAAMCETETPVVVTMYNHYITPEKPYIERQIKFKSSTKH